MTIRTVIASLAAAAALAGAATPAQAASKSCPKPKPGTLAVKPLGTVWHKGADLYACTTVYGQKPVAMRMGKWTPGTQVAFNGDDLAWTTSRIAGGVRANRIFAGNADTGKRWLSGAMGIPMTATEKQHEARVWKLILADRGIAWTTYSGEVAMALQFPEDDPQPIGTLPAPLSKTKTQQALLVARHPDADHVTLGTFLKLEVLDGEGDECGASNPYRLTYRPAADAPEAGVQWQGGWISNRCS